MSVSTIERTADSTIAVSYTHLSEIFRVQEYLTEQRRIVDRLYDYRYSRLLGVFGRLLSDGWLREGDLHGLRSQKIAKIKHEASFWLEGNL